MVPMISRKRERGHMLLTTLLLSTLLIGGGWLICLAIVRALARW